MTYNVFGVDLKPLHYYYYSLFVVVSAWYKCIIHCLCCTNCVFHVCVYIERETDHCSETAEQSQQNGHQVHFFILYKNRCCSQIMNRCSVITVSM